MLVIAKRESVQPLLRRDPAHRRLNAFTATDLATVTAADAGRVRRRDPRRDAADRGPGDDVHRLGNGRRQPDRDAARQAARRAARPDRRRRDARRTPTCWSTARAPGAGIVNQTMQFHGTADRYTLNGATAVATLYSNATTATTRLPRSRCARSATRPRRGVHLRPRAVGGLHPPGQPGVVGPGARRARRRSAPTICSSARRGDVQPDWVDLTRSRSRRPTNSSGCCGTSSACINADKKPLPRFWYFPRMLKAAVIMTGDDHAEAARPDASTSTWRSARRLLGRRLGVHPRHVVHLPEHAADQRAGGELRRRRASRSACTSTRSAPTTRRRARGELLRDQLADWTASSRACRRPTTNRTHCIAWSDCVARRRSRSTTASGSTPTTTTGRPVGARSARHVHRLGHADAVRRRRRDDDRRLPGGDADDRRVGPDVSRSRRHAARQRARRTRATTARSPRTCTRTPSARRAPTRSSPRRRPAACR